MSAPNCRSALRRSVPELVLGLECAARMRALYDDGRIACNDSGVIIR